MKFSIPKKYYKKEVVMKIMHNEVGIHCMATRKLCHTSMREVARRMGLSAAYVSDLEKGKRGWGNDLYSRYMRALNKPRKAKRK